MSDARFTDLVIKDFRLGLDAALDPSSLEANEFSAVDNAFAHPPGCVTTRYGFTHLNHTAIADSPIYALLKMEDVGFANPLVAVCDGKIWLVAGTGASTDTGYAFPGGASAYPVSMVPFQRRIYGTAWSDPPGTAAMWVLSEDTGSGTAAKSWRAGTHPPVVALTETNASGNVNGVRKYTYSYFYGESAAHGESNPCAAILTTADLTTQAVTLTIFGAGKDYATQQLARAAGIDKVRIYRTEAGGSDYYFLADIDISTGTGGLTYVDDVDADDTTTVPQSDNYPTPNGKCISIHRGRLTVGCTTDGSDIFQNRVCWSLPGYPDIFPANNYADLSNEDGTVIAIGTAGGFQYIFQERAISRLEIIGAADYTLSTVARTPGPLHVGMFTVGVESGVECAMYLANDWRVYVFDGTSVRCVSDVLGDQVASPDNSSLASCWDGRYLRITHAGTHPELRYDTLIRRNGFRGYDVGTWWKHHYLNSAGGEIAPSVYASSLAGDGKWYWATSTINGLVFLQGEWPPYVDTSDNGVAYAGSFSTGYWDCGDPSWEKRLVKILVDAKCSGVVTVTWDTDSGANTANFVLAPSATMVRTEYEVPDQVDFKRVKVSVSGAAGATFTIQSIALRVGRKRPD